MISDHIQLSLILVDTLLYISALKGQPALCGICITGYTLTGSFHGFALYLLYQVKTILSNQKYLLLNLSTIEMILSWFYVVYIISWLIDVKLLFSEYLKITRSIFVACAKIDFLQIILDRLLGIYLNIKYLLYMN